MNAATGSLVRNLSGGSYNFNLPEGLALDGRHVWVANADGNSLTVLPPG